MSAFIMSVAVKRGATLAALAARLPPAFVDEPFSPERRRSSERPGAVKGAPLLRAPERTLEGEDRSGSMGQERRRREEVANCAGVKVAGIADCH